VEQIVNNLLSNAFKFTPQNGQIKFTIAKENGNALLKVYDNGIGITLESLDKVFDRFYQSDATINRHFEGSGIGLALTKELAELHHGTINVKSESGKWTEFTVTPPMVQKENLSAIEEFQTTIISEDNPTTELTAVKKETSKNKETVLLVEDNNDLRSYISDSLSAKYNVLKAINGKEGIEIAKKDVPDIIISDVMMPETDGYQMTSVLKAHIETSHIPIILLTAKAGRDSKIEGLERGADDYINKPFDEEELILKIKNILQSRQRMQDKYRKQISVNPSEISAVSLDDQFLIKLTTIIEKYLSETRLDVDFLSKEIGMSRQHMHKKLKALTDYSPNEFIRLIRLKRAAQLLRLKTSSVSQIAYETGFDNLSYFTKRFKELYHVLPSDFQ
jgi:DNA-binding response OmpR family regulator